MNLLRKTFALLVFALLFTPRAAQACAVCFGNSDSKLANGMLAGVFVLLFVVLAVLGGFAALFVLIARKSAEAAAEAALETSSPESKTQLQ